MTKRWSLFSLFCVLFLFLFLLTDPFFHSVDKRIYTFYTQSLVSDFDLNVVNQIPEKEAWLLTTTMNYPDVHSNGIALLWAPFFFLTKLLFTGGTSSPDLLVRATQNLTNLFWGVMAVFLLWEWLRRHFPVEVTKKTFLALALTSPFYWFLLYQPQNADITSLFTAVLLLHFYERRDRMRPLAFSFLLGLFLLTAVAIKADMIFYGLIFLHLLYERRRHGFRDLFANSLGFFGGAGLMAFFLLSNEAFKNGFLNDPYLDTITGKIYLLSENLFAPSGYLITQPFWAVIVLFFLFCLWKFKDRVSSLSVFLFFVPLSELVLESFTYNQNEAFGARHWINDLPCWALVLATVFQCFKGKKWSSFLMVSAVLGGVVSGCAALVYRYDFDAYYFTGSWAAALKNLSFSEAFFFFQPRESAVKLALWPLFIAALACFFLLFFRKKKFNTGFLSLWFLSTLALGYPLITVGNLLNSEKSAKAVPERIARAVIGKGIHINSFFENAGCIERSVEYYTRKGDFDTARKRQDLLESYVARASGEILVDPIHFRETLIPGKKKYVPDELRTDE